MSHRMHLSSLLIAQLYGHCKNGRGLLLRSSQRMRQSLLTDLLSISCIRSWWLRSVQFSCHQALHRLISPMDHKPGLICFAVPWFGVPVVRVRLSRCTRWYTNDKFPYKNKCFKPFGSAEEECFLSNIEVRVALEHLVQSRHSSPVHCRLNPDIFVFVMTGTGLFSSICVVAESTSNSQVLPPVFASTSKTSEQVGRLHVVNDTFEERNVQI